MSQRINTADYLKKFAGILPINTMKNDINLNTGEIEKLANKLGLSLEVDKSKPVKWPILSEIEKLVLCTPWRKQSL